ITGVVFRAPELAAKQLGLLVEAFPDLKPIAALWEQASAEQFDAVALGQGEFIEGHELDRKWRVPKEMIGRRLSQEEAKSGQLARVSTAKCARSRCEQVFEDILAIHSGERLFTKLAVHQPVRGLGFRLYTHSVVASPSWALKQNLAPRCNRPPSAGPRQRRRLFQFSHFSPFLRLAADTKKEAQAERIRLIAAQ